MPLSDSAFCTRPTDFSFPGIEQFRGDIIHACEYKGPERFRDRRVLVVASGDLAHVGSEFGGPPLDDDARRALLQADEALLDTLRAGDAEGFYGAIRRVENANNVCGLSPIYLTLRLLENGQGHSLRGEQFGYAVCPADPHDTSVVTIAGMTFLP